MPVTYGQSSLNADTIESLINLLASEFGKQINSSIKVLFEKKHLYQTERVKVPDFESRFPQLINPVSSIVMPSSRIAVNVGNKLQPIIRNDTISAEQQKKYNYLWVNVQNIALEFVAQTAPNQQISELPNSRDKLIVVLPIISRHCPVCENVSPHHPGFLGADSYSLCYELMPIPGNRGVQVFLISYQCQQCRSEPLVFTVRREGSKLQLTGRSLFVMNPTPHFIPKVVRGFYSESLIASSAGKPLAGCLYLRLVVEHHMRTYVKLPAKATGEELADEYAKALDPEFPLSRSSLRPVYSSLSEVIHAGREDSQTFEKCLATIHEHFRMLELMPIPVSADASESSQADSIQLIPVIPPTKKLAKKPRGNHKPSQTDK